ncbi:helix-turn-helix domain-containing protein [Nocardioides sp.]|uniref:TetR/AcrR family transcriptional regulator n=1 Tax=Nocardioides sp. TaxID=35761 RepID=UPI001A2330A4|nr:helix-turn-helix domain-containing protein [Nocardioides sp.]MBJ7356876.1 TetR/AcrR family transcriptional regulator [Nocardioides sp.]
MGRPREHDDGTAAGLLDAGEELLAAGGPSAVTVRAVAQAQDTTTRAVYSLFGGKPGLVEQLAGRGYDVLTDLVSSLPETDDPAADLVAAGVHGFRVFATERPHLFRLTFERVTADTVRDEDVQARARASYTALTRWVNRAQEAGVVDDRPTAAVAYEFHSLCVGLATTGLSRRPPPDGPGFWATLADWSDEDLWRAALTALVRGMAPGDTD